MSGVHNERGGERELKEKEDGGSGRGAYSWGRMEANGGCPGCQPLTDMMVKQLHKVQCTHMPK